ncbi:MAG TPA: hypothetical protein VK446_13740 [Methylocystis sp.]|nr:hypothetical protein [Methylocystis sp.]
MIRASAAAFAASIAFSAFMPAQALAVGPGGVRPHAWVASSGSDAPTCGSVGSPCRTFQYAHDNIVLPGGAIHVVDPADYYPLIITHAISIINDGAGDATIVTTSGDAIRIVAGASDQVIIKGLVLDGVGDANNGVNLYSGGNLTVANCTITGFGGSSGAGIIIEPTTGVTTFNIFDSIVSGNAVAGIAVAPHSNISGSASASGTVRNVAMNNNGTGFSANALYTTGSVQVTIQGGAASENATGIYVVGANAQARLSGVIATLNTTVDLNNADAGAKLISFQDNIYDSSSGTISTASLH